MENKVTKTINSRVSCRNYSSKKVSNAKIELIANCGKMAPSAKFRQIANICIINSKKNVEKLRNLSLETLQRDCFYGAKTMILVYGPKDDRFTIQDCSCILQNMFIAATSLGVNSCWINQVEDLFNTIKGKKLKEKFNIDENAMIVGTCILGYANDVEKLKVKERKEDFIKKL